MKVPPRFAAFANGVAIHADDYDDTQLAVAKDRVYGLLTHPTAPALPPVLALGERDNRSGRDVLAAYQIAVEVESKIVGSDQPAPLPRRLPLHRHLGAIAAAAGAARMLGLDVEQTRRALGIAASQSAGLRENFGTMTKPFHAGPLAETASSPPISRSSAGRPRPIMLEAGRGFFQAAGGGYDPQRSTASSAIRGRSPSPACRSSRIRAARSRIPGMGLMLDLIRQHDIRPDQVVQVQSRHQPPHAERPDPSPAANELQAKFSMEFCMAILLIERKAGLAEFTDEVVNRADVSG